MITMAGDQISLYLIKEVNNSLDIWYEKGDALIPVYRMNHENIMPYAQENFDKIMSSGDILFIQDIPYLIQGYFYGRRYEGIDSFLKSFLHDVVSVNLEKSLKERGVESMQDCDIKLRFFRSLEDGLVQEVIIIIEKKINRIFLALL